MIFQGFFTGKSFNESLLFRPKFRLNAFQTEIQTEYFSDQNPEPPRSNPVLQTKQKMTQPLGKQINECLSVTDSKVGAGKWRGRGGERVHL